MRTGNHGPLIVAVLSEAIRKFGRITESNRVQVTDWVQRRVRQIERGEAEIVPFRPRAMDAKERAAGEDR